MIIIKMDWTLFWTALSGIGGIAAVISILILILNSGKKKRKTLMRTCNELCDAMSINKINTLLNNLYTISDKGMKDASAIIEIQNNLQKTVQEAKAKWEEMRLLLNSKRHRALLTQINEIVVEYDFCLRDVETIVCAIGCKTVDDIKKHISEKNSQEMHGIIITTSQLKYDVPGFVKQIISLRFKDLEFPDYASMIHKIFDNQNMGGGFFSIRLQALTGDAIAQYGLGKFYDEQKQYKRAFSWYKKSADQLFPKAQCALAVCYEFGKGIEKDETEAFNWYKKSAEQGFAEAQYFLGDCYSLSIGVDKDDREAFKWYKESAEQGFAEAQFVLGVCYEQGKGIGEDDKEAFRWYKKSAKQGFAKAQFNLALLYASGKGTNPDMEESIKWYKRAAEQGHAGAQRNLGVHYLFKGDSKEAVKLIKESAEQGDALAQGSLGSLYMNNIEVEKDEKEALKWFKKSAEQGCVESMGNLGACYEFGKGCAQDFNQAFKWYFEASQHDDVVSIFRIGMMYLNGTIGFGDPLTAMQYFQIAAQKGYSEAQFLLGYCYENGLGAKDPDIEKAKYWYNEAAKQDEEDAIDALKRLNEL